MIYDFAGDYEVLLTASSDNDCPPSIYTDTVRVHPNPTAAFTLDRDFVCGTPLIVNFTNESDLNLTNAWSFGDGGTSTELHPSYSYENAGAYPISLTVATAFGCSDTFVDSIDVFGSPEAEALLSHERACAGTTITLTATPTDANRYEWYLLPSEQPIEGRVIELPFDETGDFDLRLIAIYNEQCRDTLDLPKAVRIFEQPTADFTYTADESEQIRGDVRFTNLSRNFDELFWEFGDGATSTQTDPVHEYDLNRPIFATLTAFNHNNGLFTCTDTVRLPVEPEWIKSFEVPNAVSPGYGEPEVRQFGARGTGVREYLLRVYSPYGDLVWQTTDLEAGHPTGLWYGLHDGVPVPQGGYTWMAEVEFVDGEVRTLVGEVVVLR